MDTPAFDYRQLSIDERIQSVDDIYESILVEELERARVLALSPAQTAALLRGEVDADGCPDDGILWERARGGIM